VKTQNTNHTSFALHITVTCTAYDRAGRAFGSGSSDNPPLPDGFDLVPPADQPRDWGSQSYFRIEKVKYAEVARVDCRVAKMSK